MKRQYGGFSLFTSKEHEEEYRAILRDKLHNGIELSDFDRIYLSEQLTPKTPKQNRPPHRPKGSRTTTGRNFQLCVEYLNLLRPGESDTAFKTLAGSAGMEEGAVRKAVSGELLNHIKKLHPFIKQEEK